MHARNLVASVRFDPSTAAREWTEVSECDWSHVLVLAQRHKVAGLLYDSLAAAALLDRVPYTVSEALRFQLELTDRRQAELVDALRELADADAEIVSRAVVLKGGATLGDWGKIGYRPMSDVDLLFGVEDFDRIEPQFARLGYWRKESLNGPTYYRDRSGPGAPLCLDVHVAGPSKYHRPDSALVRWLVDSEPYELGGVTCRRLRPELELINVVTHIHEHLGSWIHALADDDVALVRLLDLELIVANRTIDVSQAWALAVEQELHGEFALGLWAHARLRGSLPPALWALAPVIDRVDDCGELVAVPGGELATWPVPLADRAFRVDRLGLCFQVLRAGLPDPARVEVAQPESIAAWRDWYRDLGAKPDYRENVEAIGDRARQRLADFMV